MPSQDPRPTQPNSIAPPASISTTDKVRELDDKRQKARTSQRASDAGDDENGDSLEMNAERKKLEEKQRASQGDCESSKHDSLTKHSIKNDDFFTRRVVSEIFVPTYLRPGTTFFGNQQSGQSIYDVEVTIKNVDMDSATLCGYLRIEGLTEDNPQLTTYFEGEMISDKYSFLTRHKDWGADAQTDLTHWSRFSPWRDLEGAKELGYVENYSSAQHLYMRWKEVFLVPDYRVEEVQGASYAGFYYICFDQVNGCISGFYYHQNWDKYQQLGLTYKSSKGWGASERLEFR